MKVTLPDTFAMIAFSFGLRASNSSATRGRPPVMSRVRAASRGMRASTSPAPTCRPPSTATIAPGPRRPPPAPPAAGRPAGDVARPRGFPRHARQHLAGLHLLTVVDRDNRARSEAVNARFGRILAQQGQAGTQVLLLGLGHVLGDDPLRDAGRLVGLLRHGAVLGEVLV